MPPALVKLDGNAESKIGDTVTSLDGARFFIFEIKPERQRIRDEWVRGGIYHPKLVYRRLKELVDECNTLRISPHEQSNNANLRNLRRSISCHHFLYWHGSDRGNCVEGTVRVEPYIFGSIAMRGTHDKTVPYTIRKLRFEAPPELSDGTETLRWLALEKLQGGRINSARHPNSATEPLGLTATEFEKYLRFLCGAEAESSDFDQWQAAAEDVHIVVLSDEGGFFRVLSDTNQLVSLIDGEFRPEPIADNKVNLPESKYRRAGFAPDQD